MITEAKAKYGILILRTFLNGNKMQKITAAARVMATDALKDIL